MPLLKTPIYAQLSDSTNQQPETLEIVKVRFNINDGISGIEHSETERPEDIKILADGAYFIMAAGQIGRTSGSLLRFIDMWLAVNGQEMPNSNVRGSIPASLFVGDTYVLVAQAVLELKAGDILNVMISINAIGNGLGLIATKPEKEPLIPSMIFTMYKI